MENNQSQVSRFLKLHQHVEWILLDVCITHISLSLQSCSKDFISHVNACWPETKKRELIFFHFFLSFPILFMNFNTSSKPLSILPGITSGKWCLHLYLIIHFFVELTEYENTAIRASTWMHVWKTQNWCQQFDVIWIGYNLRLFLHFSQRGLNV